MAHSPTSTSTRRLVRRVAVVVVLAAAGTAGYLATRPKEDAPVVAANHRLITKVGENKELGKFTVLRDAYGNEFTYAELGEISDVIPVPKERELSADDFDLVTPGGGDTPPKVEASDTSRGGDAESDPQADDAADRATTRAPAVT